MKAKYSDMYLQLGLKIAYYRKLRGLTQEQLARETGQESGVYRPCGSAEYQQSGLAGHAF